MQWFLFCMILVMPFEKNPYFKFGEYFLGIFPDFTLIKLLGIVGIVLVFWLTATGQVRLGLSDLRSSKALLIYMTLIGLAAAVSGSTPRAITRFLGLFLFLPIMLAAIQNEAAVRRTLWVGTGVMIICLPYAFRQLLRYGGRLGVGLYEPNYFALALVLLIPLAFVLARQQQHPLARGFWYLGLGGLIVSMIWTGSRGGLLGFLTCMGILSLRMWRRALLPSLALVGVLVTLFTTSTPVGQRILASGFVGGIEDAGVEASNQAHMDLFYTGLHMIAANPVFGVGLGNFKDQSGLYYDLVKDRIAHNTFIHIGAESGLLALAAFVLLLVFVFLSLHNSGRTALALERPHVHEWTVALQAGLGGYLVAACFLSAQFEKFFWVFLFISIVLEHVMLRQMLAQDDRDDVDELTDFQHHGVLEATTVGSRWY